MNGHVSIVGKYYQYRSRFWRNVRFLFPSPAETAFIELMGGYVIHVSILKHPKTHFSFAYVLSLGKLLNGELMKREVRVGKHWIDFGNDIKRGIEIDGRQYHNDIVKQQERDDYFKSYGWRVLHVDAYDVFHEPKKVYRMTSKFLLG